MKDSKNRLERNNIYYLEFGKLFREISGDSGLLNLGCKFKDRNILHPKEAQRQLVFLVAELGEFESGHRILDVGCGLGGGAQLVSEKINARVTGIDPVLGHLLQYHEWLKKRGDKIQPAIHCGDALHLPYLTDTFDRVYSIESAFHYPDKAQFLREARRILRPKGKLVITDILRSFKPPFPILTKLMLRAVSAASFYSKEDYQSRALEAGLQLETSIDISADVSRTFPLWRRAYLAKWKSLRQNYTLPTLVVIWFALFFVPAITRLVGLKYMILAFEPRV